MEAGGRRGPGKGRGDTEHWLYVQGTFSGEFDACIQHQGSYTNVVRNTEQLAQRALTSAEDGKEESHWAIVLGRVLKSQPGAGCINAVAGWGASLFSVSVLLGWVLGRVTSLPRGLPPSTEPSPSPVSYSGAGLIHVLFPAPRT